MKLTCDETLKEWLVREVGIVILEMFLRWSDHLQGNKLVTSLLKSGDDISDQPALPKSLAMNSLPIRS